MASLPPLDDEEELSYSRRRPSARQRRIYEPAAPGAYIGAIQSVAREDASRELVLAEQRDPIAAASARRLARDMVGVSAALIETALPQYRMQAQTQRNQQILARAPQLTSWLTNPENAAVARDDIPQLSLAEEALTLWSPGRQPSALQRALGHTTSALAAAQTLSNVVQAPITARENEARYALPMGPGIRSTMRPGVTLEELGAVGVRAGQHLASVGATVLGQAGSAFDTFNRTIYEAVGLGDYVAPAFNENQRVREEFVASLTPENMGPIEQGFHTSLQSIALLAAAAATRNPKAILPIISGASGTSFYTEHRARGAGHLEALLGGLVVSKIEYITEALPTAMIINAFGGRGVKHGLTRFLFAEMGGEHVAEATQSLVSTQVTGGMSMDEYINTIGERHLNVTIATLFMSGMFGGVNLVRAASAPQRQQDMVETAAIGQATIDALMEDVVAKSKLMEGDPQGFREYIDQLQDATGSAARNVHIPVEAIEAYAQSEGADMAPFELLQDQIAEATRTTRGDVVIPLGQALVMFNGSKAWDAIREDIRLTGGGLSMREARTRMEDEAFFQEIDQRVDGMAEESAQSKQKESRFKQVTTQVYNSFVASGVNREEARANAAVHAAVMLRMEETTGVKAEELVARVQTRLAEEGEKPAGQLEQRAETPLRGLPQRIKVNGETIEFGPLPVAREAHRRYAERRGAEVRAPREYARVDPDRGQRIAQAFEEMEHNPSDPEVKAAYQALIDETLAQWEAIKETGLKVEFIEGEDPYGNPRNAILDVVNNNHLWVYPTDTGFGEGVDQYPDNPLLAIVPGEKISGKPVRVNDIFRIVHDYFGHIMEGVGFRADGEENAWRIHSAMFSSLARRALTTETRGQNSWVNFGPFGETNRTAGPGDTKYAPQKIGLLPDWVVEEGAFDNPDLAYAQTLAAFATDQDGIPSAGWTEARISGLIDQYGNDEGGSTAFAVMMSPDQYLGLTAARSGRKLIEQRVAEMDQYGALDPARLASLPPIWLEVALGETPSNYQITQLGITELPSMTMAHDGRHRMQMLKNAGITQVPVVIRTTQKGRDVTVDKVMETITIGPQRSRSDQDATGDQKAELTNAVPISWANREKLLEMSDSGRVLFQRNGYWTLFGAAALGIASPAQTPGSAPAAPVAVGQVEAGNIDLRNRPVVQNADGSISTVRSISIGSDRGEVLIPTVSPDGRILSDEEAIALYEETGAHLGIFDTPEHATAYAEALHTAQERAYRQGVRGQTQILPDGKFIVTLFASQNKSTMIHELGHVYLEMMADFAQQDSVSQELKDDVDRIYKWFAANGHPVVDGKIPREAHEMWARGLERFVMEGKAPNKGLRAAFRNFANWLKDIYRTVERLRTPITPEIRDVMNRMMTAEQAMSTYEQEAAAQPMTQEQLDMTDAQYAAYLEQVQGARDDAYATLLERLLRGIRNRELDRNRRARDEIRAEVAAEVNARPEFVALHLLRTGKWLGDPGREATPVKLNTGWLIDTFGEDVLTQLPRGIPIHRGDGIHGDELAEMVGAQSGNDLVQQLLALRLQSELLKANGEPRSARDVMIDGLVDERMAEREEEIMTEEQMREEAIGAINSVSQGEVIAAELEQLRKRSTTRNPRRTVYTVAREWAKRKVYAERIVDVASRQAIQRYIRNANKAQRAAEGAMLEGNIDEAFNQKQAQLLNHALLAEAKAAADQVERIVARMKRYAGRKAMQSVDQDYFDRVHELLERFDFRQRSQTLLDEKASFEAWAEKERAKGNEVHVPPELAGIGDHYSRVTVSDLLALDSAVDSLMWIGRSQQQLKLAEEAANLQETLDLIAANIKASPGRKLKKGVSEKQERPLVDWNTELLKVSVIAQDMDNGDPQGPLTKLLVYGAKHAANTRDKIVDMVLVPLAQAYKAMPKRVQRTVHDMVTAQSLTWNALNEDDSRRGQLVTMSRLDWMTVALNTGNISNLEKMAQGEQWDPNVIREELNRILTKEEWDFVHSIGRNMEKLWPFIVENERELSGVVPEPVVPMDIETPHGTYKGWYWPVVYDRLRPGVGMDIDAKNTEDPLGFRSGIGTPKGHTISRTEARGPMNYRLEDILVTHMEDVSTRIAYAVWARDVLKVINNQRFKQLVITYYGPEYLRHFVPWLRRQIAGNRIDTRGNGRSEKIARTIRTNMTINAMGLAYSTGIAQTLGLSASIGRIGAKYMSYGMKRTLGFLGGAGTIGGGTLAAFLTGGWSVPIGMSLGAMAGGSLGGFQAAKQFIFERSPEMAKRSEQWNREVQEVFTKLRGKHSWKAWLDAQFFLHIGLIDRYMVAMPTWFGAYQQGLDGKAKGHEGTAMTEQEAIDFADQMVLHTQGGGREKDLSAFQSPNSNYARFFSMFYTPFSVQHNALWESAQLAKRGAKGSGAVRRSQFIAAGSMTFFFVILPALADALMSGDWPEDDDDDGMGFDDIGAWFMRNGLFSMVSGVPFARDAASYVERKMTGKYSNLESPFSQLVETVERPIAKRIRWREGEGFPIEFKEAEFDGAEFRAIANAIGIAFGLPGSQTGKTGGFFIDYFSEEAQPEDVRDWYSGVLYGKLPEDEERDR